MAFRRKNSENNSGAESKKNNFPGVKPTTEHFMRLLRKAAYAIYNNAVKASVFCAKSVRAFLYEFTRFTVLAAKGLWYMIEVPARKLGIRFYKVYIRTVTVITEPYRSFRAYFKVIKRRLDESNEDASSAKVVLKTVKEGARRNKSLIAKTILNYTAPVVCIFALVCVVHFAESLTFAVEVTFNDQTIGTVSEENVYTTAHNMLMQQIVYDGDEDSSQISTDSQLTLKLASESELVDSDTLVGRMVQSSGEDIVEAVGIYINGNLLGSVTDSEPITTALNNILLKYKKKNSTSISFADDIELKSGIYLTETLQSEKKIVKTLKSNKTKKKTYKLKKGDTPSGVAEKFNVKIKTLYSLNPGLKKKFNAGRKITITAKVPFLSVKEVRREKYTKTLSYDTEYVNDSTQLKGYTETIRSGKTGKVVVTADITYVNGVETARKVVSKKVTKQPVSKKVKRGTKTISSTYSAGPSATVIGNSQFIWPVNGGYTSSHYGYRDGSLHKGTDIAASAGTAVYAAASGTVSLATWYSGYGKCVIIDHGNGIQTLYGHNSAIYVSAGQTVSQGQNISAVGMTGWATGNHCHFEVRINGSCVNPETYIGTR